MNILKRLFKKKPQEMIAIETTDFVTSVALKEKGLSVESGWCWQVLKEDSRISLLVKRNPRDKELNLLGYPSYTTDELSTVDSRFTKDISINYLKSKVTKKLHDNLN